MNTKMTAVVSAIRSPRFWGAVSWIAPGLALANPTGGDVVGGAAAISAPDANTVRIDQTTDSAVINWQSFSIDGHEFVIFNQPSVSSATLNRVLGENPSAIFGHIQANGRVFLINPNGVLFGQGAQVDVNGLVATTLDISPQDFMAGKFELKGSSDKGVVNAGSIQTADGGFVVLAGDHVQNSGQIAARLGKVVLASGSEVTLDIKGNGLVSYAINAAAVTDSAGVENLGSIAADGGAVYMDARVARSLTATVVNNAGLVQARSITTDKRGGIYLNGDGGDVVNSGVLDASTAEAGSKGGTVIVRSTKDITLTDGSRISANGPSGGEIRIVAEEVAKLNPGSVVEATGPGGFIELSGHGRLDINGEVNLSHGTLLIDPDRVEIYGGSGAAPADFEIGTSRIGELFIESQLQAGNDVLIVATHQVQAANQAGFVNGDIDGRDTDSEPGYGGSLTLGVGSATGYGGFDAYGLFYGATGYGTFTRGPGDGAGGVSYGIHLQNVAIRTDDDITIISGYANDDVLTGDLESLNGDVSIEAYGTITTGTINAYANVDLHSEYGSISDIGDIAAGTSIDLTAVTISLNGKHLYAPEIEITGDDGVTLTNSTLAGAAGSDENYFTHAADTIGIHAGETGDILIEFTPDQQVGSITADDITIAGRDVTIRNDILSGGHDGSGNVHGAMEGISIIATGDAVIEDAQLAGAEVSVSGANVTVSNTEIFGSFVSGSDESSSFSEYRAADSIELLAVTESAVLVEDSLLVAELITLRGDDSVTVRNSTLTGHRGFGDSSSAAFSFDSNSFSGSISGTSLSGEQTDIVLDGGAVEVRGSRLAARSIDITGNGITIGSDTCGDAGPTLMGKTISDFSFFGSSSFSAQGTEVTGADTISIVGTGSSVDENYSPGDVLIEQGSKLAGAHITVNSSDSVTVRGSLLAGGFSQIKATLFGSSAGTPGTPASPDGCTSDGPSPTCVTPPVPGTPPRFFTDTVEAKTASAADLIEIQGGSEDMPADVTVSGSGIAANRITITGADITLTGDSTELAPLALGGQLTRARFGSSSCSGSGCSLMPVPGSGTEVFELMAGTDGVNPGVTITGTGTVTISGGGIAGDSITVRGNQVTLGGSSDAFPETFLGGQAHFLFSSSSSSFSLENGSNASRLDVLAYADGMTVDTARVFADDLTLATYAGSDGSIQVSDSTLFGDDITINGDGLVTVTRSTLAGGLEFPELPPPEGGGGMLTECETDCGPPPVLLRPTMVGADSIEITGTTVEVSYGSLFAGDISVDGQDGVQILNSSLSGGFEAPELPDPDDMPEGGGHPIPLFPTAVAANSIDIFAGSEAAVLIQFDQQEQSTSITANTITIEGGNVTIRNEILSAGHNFDNSEIAGAALIDITATGSGAEQGMLTVEGSQLVGAQITLDGNESVTVQGSLLAGGVETVMGENVLYPCTSDCAGSSGSFTRTDTETTHGANAISVFGGTVTITDSLLAANSIAVSGDQVDLGGRGGVIGLAGVATRSATFSGTYSTSSGSFSFSSVGPPYDESMELGAAGSVSVTSTGSVSFSRGSISANSIAVRGDTVSIGSSGDTFLGGAAHFAPFEDSGFEFVHGDMATAIGVVADGGSDGLAGTLTVGNSLIAANTISFEAADSIDATGSLLSIGAQGNFVAPSVTTGTLEMVGTNLFFNTDVLTFAGAGSIYRPGDLDPSEIFARFAPLTVPNMRLEQSIAGIVDPEALLIGVDEHLSVFPGTTFGFGGDGFGGAINIGLNGMVNGDPDNFIFIGGPAFILNGLDQLFTTGTVVVLRPLAEIGNLINQTGQLTDDEEKRRREQEQSGEVEVTESAPNGQVEQAPPASAQECT